MRWIGIDKLSAFGWDNDSKAWRKKQGGVFGKTAIGY